jgi:hypothetical protein
LASHDDVQVAKFIGSSTCNEVNGGPLAVVSDESSPFTSRLTELFKSYLKKCGKSPDVSFYPIIEDDLNIENISNKIRSKGIRKIILFTRRGEAKRLFAEFSKHQFPVQATGTDGLGQLDLFAQEITTPLKVHHVIRVPLIRRPMKSVLDACKSDPWCAVGIESYYLAMKINMSGQGIRALRNTAGLPYGLTVSSRTLSSQREFVFQEVRL